MPTRLCPMCTASKAAYLSFLNIITANYTEFTEDKVHHELRMVWLDATKRAITILQRSYDPTAQYRERVDFVTLVANEIKDTVCNVRIHCNGQHIRVWRTIALTLIKKYLRVLELQLWQDIPCECLVEV